MSFQTGEARDRVIRTIIGEAGGEGPNGWRAVAHVIKNRYDLGRFGRNLSEILRPDQFSANARPMNISPDEPLYQRVGVLVDRIFDGQDNDPTQGATHYYNPTTAQPAWGPGMQGSMNIGNHRFGRADAPPMPPASIPAKGMPAAGRLEGRFSGILNGIAQQLEQAGIPLTVISDYRDPAHNKRVGGASGSQHIHGRAVDIDLKGLTEDQQKQAVQTLLSTPGVNGFGYYPNSNTIHVDSRPGYRAVWGGDRTRGSIGQGWPAWMTQIAQAFHAGQPLPQIAAPMTQTAQAAPAPAAAPGPVTAGDVLTTGSVTPAAAAPQQTAAPGPNVTTASLISAAGPGHSVSVVGGPQPAQPLQPSTAGNVAVIPASQMPAVPSVQALSGPANPPAPVAPVAAPPVQAGTPLPDAVPVAPLDAGTKAAEQRDNFGRTPAEQIQAPGPLWPQLQNTPGANRAAAIAPELAPPGMAPRPALRTPLDPRIKPTQAAPPVQDNTLPLAPAMPNTLNPNDVAGPLTPPGGPKTPAQTAAATQITEVTPNASPTTTGTTSPARTGGGSGGGPGSLSPPLPPRRPPEFGQSPGPLMPTAYGGPPSDFSTMLDIARGGTGTGGPPPYLATGAYQQNPFASLFSQLFGGSGQQTPRLY